MLTQALVKPRVGAEKPIRLAKIGLLPGPALAQKEAARDEFSSQRGMHTTVGYQKGIPIRHIR